MKIGIYKITNPKNKLYIGKSKDIETRFNSYKKIQHCKQQRKLYNSLKKYGPENHIFEIIEECSYSELNNREIFWIKKTNSIKKGLNLTLGGDGGELCEESKELKRIKIMKPILQYSLEGDFIKEYKGASDVLKELKCVTNANNINDCARGKYKSTYGFQWVYKKDNYFPLKIDPYKRCDTLPSWTEERRRKTINSRKDEKRSEEYKEKIRRLKQKPIYQFDINNNLTNIFPSFEFFNKSGIIGTKKLRKILNKHIYYKEYRYSNIKPLNLNKNV
jgi:group I intron endonuclease